MAITLTELLQGVKSRLQLTNDTIVARLPITTTPLAPALTNDQVMTGFLNDGADEIARDVFPILTTAFYTMPSDTNVVRIQDIADPQGRVLHLVRSVSVNCIPVTSSGFEQMQTGLNAYLNRPKTQPQLYWNDTGIVGFNQVQASGTPIQFTGYALPIPMNDIAPDVSTLDSISDLDGVLALEFYCCWMVAANISQNENIGPRAPEYKALYDMQKLTLAQRLIAIEPDVAAGYFSKAIAITRATGGRRPVDEG